MNRIKFIHPFLFALYPALFLYSVNISHFTSDVLLTPLLISIAAAIIIFSITFLILRKLEISTIISSFIILVLFSFSRLKQLFGNPEINLGNISISSENILFAGTLLAFIATIFLVLRYKRYLNRINKLLGAFSLALLAITLYNTAFYEIKMGRISLAGIVSQPDQLQGSITAQPPDIYYFVLDRYAGGKTLTDYGFDNSPFLNFLKKEGFYIAAEATSNYPKTFLSLGSTLNMEYLDYLTQKTKGGATSDESIVTPLVKNNKVIKFLKNKGYFYIHVGSGWDPTRLNSKADLNFVLKDGRYPFADEFTSGFLHTTMVSSILSQLFPDPTAVSKLPKNNEERSRNLYEFEVFNQIPQIRGPKFVFTHILIPHDPYVLGKDCEPLPEKVISKRSERENYINQLQCTNKKMGEAVEKILAQSQTKPVILIQADEGPLPIKNPISTDVSWKNASDASLKEKFPILSAWLLPEIETNPLYPTITPVNSFRIIFNAYFGTKLPLLLDKNIIFEDDKNYYKFIDVTEKVKGEGYIQN